MGKLFKNIGKFVKKNVSIKTLVKGVKTFGSMIPGVGGIASGVIGAIDDKHQQKKAEREQADQERAMQAEYEKAKNQAQAQGASQVEAEQIATNTVVSKNPNIKDILAAGAGGALSAIGNEIGGSSTVANAGATVVDSTLTAYVKKNWLKLVGGILGATLVIFLFVKMLNGKKHGYRRR